MYDANLFLIVFQYLNIQEKAKLEIPRLCVSCPRSRHEESGGLQFSVLGFPFPSMMLENPGYDSVGMESKDLAPRNSLNHRQLEVG